MRLLRVEPSLQRHKKLRAVFGFGGGGGKRTKAVNFGGRGCGDYIQYSALRGSPAGLAQAKRRAYIARHGATESWKDPTAPATLSRYLLWERPTLRGAVASYRKRFKV